MKSLNHFSPRDIPTLKRFSGSAAFGNRTIAMLLIYSIITLTLAVGAPAQKKGRSIKSERSKVTTDPVSTISSQDQGNLKSPAKPIYADAVGPNVAQQISALDDEKESRTPAQQKIDSQLIYATKMYLGKQIAAGVQTLEVDVNLENDGRVVVDITTVVDNEVLTAIKQNGGEILVVSETYQSIRARLPITQLEMIAALPQVRFIQPKQQYRLSQQMQRPGLRSPKSDENILFPSRGSAFEQLFSDSFSSVKPLPNGTLSTGSTASEGDTTHRVSTARGTFNVDGTGIKIGVLSDGVTSLATSQALGDLGTVTVLPGQTGSGDEGTAMLEIVHDLAPGAQLFFATADPTITQFAQNIRDLRTAGCDIIVDDVGYFVESSFQDGQSGVTNTNGGVVTQAVNDVVAGGALYFSSAANSGNKNDNTSTTWEGDFVSGGTLAIVPGGGLVNDFDPSAAVAQVNIITLGGGTGVPINLSWSDPLGASTNDYDLFILNNAGTAVSVSSTNVQTGTQDPYEQVTTNNTTGRRVVIRQKTGAANRFLHLDLNGGRMTFNTQGETHGHAAASGGYGVAATPAFASFNFPPPVNFGPYPSAFSTANSVETFSSDGPRRIFFQGNGTAITPGDFSSTGGQVLQQPVITAADGVSVTGSGGFQTPFFGTSAAAPHAAAIAALLKSADPLFTPAQIKTALTTTSLDIETAGTDRDAGFGIVMPYPALQSLGVTGKAFIELGSVTATETCCNSNGLIERAEKGDLNVVLNNPGLVGATAVTASLSTTTPGVVILNGSSNYSDMAATSGTATNTTPLSFRLTPGSAVDVVANFQLTVNYSGGWNASQILNFTVETGRKTITTVLDTNTPATDQNFPTSATGTQTNLVFPDDPASTCAAPTAFPGTLTSTTPRFDSYTLTNITAAPVCATITLTNDKSATGAIEIAAYTGSFTPASVGTNYLGDAGFSAVVFPGFPGVFSVNVPAAGTIVIVVVELKSPANGFPTALGSTYTLKVAGLPVTPLSPTAALASVVGRVSAGATGIRGATVTMTDATGHARTAMTSSFGYFRFDEIESGKAYVVQVKAKQYTFAPRVVTINEDLLGLNFEAQ
ncbi:MAG: S8 family serine peptidase [Acidobacteriota bacterium]